MTNPKDKMWRTVVRIQKIDFVNKEIVVIIPGWDTYLPVVFGFDEISSELVEELENIRRFHAKVNIGTDTKENLKIEGFEK